ncbi:MAG: hypothetical protein WD824_15915 [Cyclobacteriaceae bacterium]
MARIIFSSIIVLHGLLHLIGFAKEWNIGSQGQLSGKTLIHLQRSTSKIAGAMWFLACFLFLSAAICYLLRREWYWIPTAAALLISQTLIIIYWNDAKYGTIVNVVILVAVIFSSAAIL